MAGFSGFSGFLDHLCETVCTCVCVSILLSFIIIMYRRFAVFL